jgi:hypothetical protein
MRRQARSTAWAVSLFAGRHFEPSGRSDLGSRKPISGLLVPLRPLFSQDYFVFLSNFATGLTLEVLTLSMADVASRF